MENYLRGKLLGKGSFGSAVLCVSKLDGKNYVIKEVDISRMPKAEREAAEQEAQLLMALKHPNIVRCKECFTSGSKLCIVMDWCSEGDLYGILQKRKNQPLPEDTVLDWFVQICLGLKHVHDRKILHRDIKSQNIFVSAGGLLKLGDFGVSKVLNSTFALATTAVGTPYYLSPEICQNRKYNQKSDMWSLGCVLYELTTMRHAFEAPNMRALIQKIIKGAFTPLPPSRSPELRSLIASLLTLDAKKRPGINDVLAMPVVRARIARFLNQTLQQHEFSHTVIHGRPQPGQLVVALPLGGAGADAAVPQAAAQQALAEVPGAAGAGAGGGGGGGRIRLSAPAAMGPPAKLSAQPAAAAPRLSGAGFRPPLAAARPPVMPIPSAAAAAMNLRSPSKEQLLPSAAAAAAVPVKSPSRAASPSAGKQQQQQQQQQLVSPKLSPRGPSPQLSPRGPTPQLSPRGGKLPSPRGDRAAVPAAAAAAGADAVAAARQRAQQAQQEREAIRKEAEARRAAEAEAACKGAADAYQQRQAAAAAAAAEMVRLRAADERAAAEAAAARAAAEKRKAEARQGELLCKQQEAQARQQRAADEAAAQKAAEEARARARLEEAAQRRAAEDVRARAKAAAEAERREAAAAVREHERQQMHLQMQQQKQEYLDRQKAAAANRRRVEDQMRGAAQPPNAADAAGVVIVAAAAAPAAAVPRQRKAWSPPRMEGFSSAGGNGGDEAREAQQQQQQQPVGGRRATAAAAAAAAAGSAELSAQQRRQVWEEMRAAAQRNKQQLIAAQGGGLAAFLGARQGEEEEEEEQQHQKQQQQQQQQHQKQQQASGAPRQQQQQPQHCLQQATNGNSNQHNKLCRNDITIHNINDNVISAVINGDGEDGDDGVSPWERRRRRLEFEQAAREAALRDWQRQHWLEVKAAAARNRQQVMGELGIGKQQQQQQQHTSADLAAHAGQQQQQQKPQPGAAAQSPSVQELMSLSPTPAAGAAAVTAAAGNPSEDDTEQGDAEFAAMVADMQDLVLVSEGQQQHVGAVGVVGNEFQAEEQEEMESTQQMVLAGQFMLDGVALQLPVSSSDSLGLKVEALRMFLEEALGTSPFLKVYHRLESLGAEEDDEAVSREFLELLGPAKLPYLQLVHQLIIAEESMHVQQAG